MDRGDRQKEWSSLENRSSFCSKNSMKTDTGRTILLMVIRTLRSVYIRRVLFFYGKSFKENVQERF